MFLSVYFSSSASCAANGSFLTIFNCGVRVQECTSPDASRIGHIEIVEHHRDAGYRLPGRRRDRQGQLLGAGHHRGGAPSAASAPAAGARVEKLRQ